MAFEVAQALQAPLDLVFVRKLGAPGHEEFAIGAVVDGDPPQVVRNEQVIAALRVPESYIAGETARQVAEIARRRAAYLGDRPPVSVEGRTAVVIDDGIATGATVRAALSALERAGAARRVLAAPVAPRDTARALRKLCDEAVFLAEPTDLGSVGAFYGDFRQLDDAEVVALLGRVAAGRKSAG